MKVNVFKFTDTRTGETFTGSIEECYKYFNITKTALQNRMHTKWIKREWLGYKDNGRGRIHLTTYTNVKSGESIYGTQSDAERFFGLTNYGLNRLIKQGWISVGEIKIVKDEPKKKVAKLPPNQKSDSKTKRALNKAYLERAIILGI